MWGEDSSEKAAAGMTVRPPNKWCPSDRLTSNTCPDQYPLDPRSAPTWSFHRKWYPNYGTLLCPWKPEGCACQGRLFWTVQWLMGMGMNYHKWTGGRMRSSNDDSDVGCHSYDSLWKHPLSNQSWSSGAFLDGPPCQVQALEQVYSSLQARFQLFSESDGPRHGGSLLIQERLYESYALSAGRCNLLPLLSCKDVNLPTTVRGCFCDWFCFTTWHVKGPSKSRCHLAKVPAFLTQPRESEEKKTVLEAPCHTLALGIYRESCCEGWESIQILHQLVSGLYRKI